MGQFLEKNLHMSQQHVEIIKKELFYATRPPMHVLLVKMLPILQNYSFKLHTIIYLTFACDETISYF